MRCSVSAIRTPRACAPGLPATKPGFVQPGCDATLVDGSSPPPTRRMPTAWSYVRRLSGSPSTCKAPSSIRCARDAAAITVEGAPDQSAGPRTLALERYSQLICSGEDPGSTPRRSYQVKADGSIAEPWPARTGERAGPSDPVVAPWCPVQSTDDQSCSPGPGGCTRWTGAGGRAGLRGWRTLAGRLGRGQKPAGTGTRLGGRVVLGVDQSRHRCLLTGQEVQANNFLQHHPDVPAQPDRLPVACGCFDLVKLGPREPVGAGNGLERAVVAPGQPRAIFLHRVQHVLCGGAELHRPGDRGDEVRGRRVRDPVEPRRRSRAAGTAARSRCPTRSPLAPTGPGRSTSAPSRKARPEAGSCSGGSGPGPILCRSMVGEKTSAWGPQPEGRRASRDDRVWLAMWVGLILALVGVVDGFVMALKRHVAPCPNGTYFPKGTTNFDCYVHPNAGTGIAIAVISALLGILVVLAAISAALSPRSG